MQPFGSGHSQHLLLIGHEDEVPAVAEIELRLHFFVRTRDVADQIAVDTGVRCLGVRRGRGTLVPPAQGAV